MRKRPTRPVSVTPARLYAPHTLVHPDPALAVVADRVVVYSKMPRPERRRSGECRGRSCAEEADAEREHAGREADGAGIEEQNEPVGLGGAAAG
jgi:hypothetical protein